MQISQPARPETLETFSAAANAPTGAFGPEITAPGLHQWLVGEALADVSRTNGVLDLACGAGAWLRRLQAAGFSQLRGVDWNTPIVDEPELQITNGDLEADEIGLGDAQFGLVCLVEIIEHMHNPGRLLRHAVKHVRDDGVILITTPNVHSLIQRLKYLVTGRFAHFDFGSDPTHYQPVVIDAWKRMLPRYGLQIERIDTWPRSRHLGGIHPAWKYAAGALSPFLKDPFPGECLVLRLVKAPAPRAL